MVKKIFTLDEDAIKVLEDSDFNLTVKPKSGEPYELGAGTEFAIVSRDKLEVRATMIDPTTNKPKRGRPRRFPSALVTRLLGEDVSDNSVDTPVEVEVEEDAVVFVDDAETLDVELDELDEEEQKQRVAECAALFDKLPAGEDF
jgi:hypothetical protein